MLVVVYATMTGDPPCTPPKVIHRTEQFVVIDKPIGWHCTEVRGSADEPCIERWLRVEMPALSTLPECGLVHRLDRSTSGCLLAALDAESLADLRERFTSASGAWAVRKRYLALVSGGIASNGEFTLYFSSRHKRSAKVTVKPHGEASQRGQCKWQVLRPAHRGSPPDSPAAFDLVAVDLVGPGRRHQIRAGLASIGAPLAGDAFYGGPILGPQWNQSMAALHAWQVEVSGERIESARPRWAT